MNYRSTILYNSLELPAYWAACRRLREKMIITEEKVKYGKHSRQYAIVLRGAAPHPGKFAFYFHGGAWTFGRPETFVPAAIPWLEQGFTVVMPSYRRPPEVGLNRIMADCRAAIAALAPAGQVTSLHLGGISAGAHLAALLALHPTWWQAAGWPMSPQKTLLCAGPLCLHLLKPQLLFRRYGHLNPHAVLTLNTMEKPAWLLLHGTADATVPFQHSQDFHTHLQQTGHSARLHPIPGGTHLDSGRWMFGGAGAEEVRLFLAED